MTEPRQLENKALAEFREKHFHELDNCLKASIGIRDNTLSTEIGKIRGRQETLAQEYRKCEDDKSKIRCLEKQVSALAEILIMAEKVSAAPPRERNVAIRNIAAMLGALTEKSAPAQTKKQVRIDAPEHDGATKAELEELLSAI